MAKHLEIEVERIKKLIYALCARVDENLELAVKSFQSGDDELAEKVIANDVVDELWIGAFLVRALWVSDEREGHHHQAKAFLV